MSARSHDEPSRCRTGTTAIEAKPGRPAACRRVPAFGATLPLVNELAKDSCPHPLRSLLRDALLANGFRTGVLRDYTGASDFRTRSTVASLGSCAILKPSSRHMSSIGLFWCSTKPTSSAMPDCCAISISRAINRCPTPRPCQSLRTATANSALREPLQKPAAMIVI
jgi:hypothetical protein